MASPQMLFSGIIFTVFLQAAGTLTIIISKNPIKSKYKLEEGGGDSTCTYEVRGVHLLHVDGIWWFVRTVANIQRKRMHSTCSEPRTLPRTKVMVP